MSNLQRHKDCTMRSEIGNCVAMGGFCTSVNKEICEALQKAYANGRHSTEVCAISHYINGYREATQRLERFYLGEAKRYTDKDVPTSDRPQGKWKAKNFHECFCEKCGFSFDIMKCDFLENMRF